MSRQSIPPQMVVGTMTRTVAGVVKSGVAKNATERSALETTDIGMTVIGTIALGTTATEMTDIARTATAMTAIVMTVIGTTIAVETTNIMMTAGEVPADGEIAPTTINIATIDDAMTVAEMTPVAKNVAAKSILTNPHVMTDDGKTARERVKKIIRNMSRMAMNVATGSMVPQDLHCQYQFQCHPHTFHTPMKRSHEVRAADGIREKIESIVVKSHPRTETIARIWATTQVSRTQIKWSR
jgi:hypothetical protein